MIKNRTFALDIIIQSDGKVNQKDMDKVSYALGMNIGHQLLQMGGKELDIDDFATGIKDVMAGKEPAVDAAEAQRLLQAFFAEQESRQQASMAEKGKAARAEGEAFLAENAKKEGVVVLPSGLQYQVLVAGTGSRPKATDKVKCHYEGRLVDGTVFDSSYRRGEPAVFPLNGVIKGWTEGVQLMAEGAKYRFFIPYDLAYGTTGAGASIPPYAALVFDVELISVL